MMEVDINQSVSDLNALASLLSGGECPYARLKELTRASAAFANVYGDRKALIVLEVDMDTQIGQLAKEAADKITSLTADNQKLQDANKQLTTDAASLQDELTTAEGQLQAALDASNNTAGGTDTTAGGGGTDTTVGGGGVDTTVPPPTADPAVGQKRAPQPVRPIANVPARPGVVAQPHK